MKAIAPKISDTAAEFFPQLFSNLHKGVTYALEIWPTLYKRTLIEMRGRFTADELTLIVEAFQGLNLNPDIPGQFAGINVSNAIDLKRLEDKRSVNKKTLVKKIEGLTIFQTAALEIWASAYWQGKRNKEIKLEKWIEGLK